MRRLVVGITVLAVFSTVFVEVASAGRTGITLTLKAVGAAADGRVGPDEKIVLEGAINSPRARCERVKAVKLFIDGNLFGETTTNEQGLYRFSVRGPHPQGRHEFQTKRKMTRACKGDASNIVVVTVGG